ncbi:hypothetical protein VCCP104417_1916, partial [Vibrio cholerae CP1044(17)]
MEPTVAKKG